MQRIGRALLELREAEIETLGFLAFSVDYQSPDANLVGRGFNPSECIDHERLAQTSPLLREVDPKSRKNDDGDRVLACSPFDPIRCLHVKDSPACKGVVANNQVIAQATDNTHSACARLMRGERMAFEPERLSIRTAIELRNVVGRG